MEMEWDGMGCERSDWGELEHEGVIEIRLSGVLLYLMRVVPGR